MTSYGGKLLGRTSLTMPSTDITGDSNFDTVLEFKVCVSPLHTRMTKLSNQEANMTNWYPRKIILTLQYKVVDAYMLAKRWNTPIDQTKNIVQIRIQRGVCHVVNSSIVRRFLTNDWMLRYTWLPHPLITVNLLAGTTSKQGNAFAQVFETSYGWVLNYAYGQEEWSSPCTWRPIQTWGSTTWNDYGWLQWVDIRLLWPQSAQSRLP